jgi:hypothetical protein
MFRLNRASKFLFLFTLVLSRLATNQYPLYLLIMVPQ